MLHLPRPVILIGRDIDNDEQLHCNQVGRAVSREILRAFRATSNGEPGRLDFNASREISEDPSHKAAWFNQRAKRQPINRRISKAWRDTRYNFEVVSWTERQNAGNPGCIFASANHGIQLQFRRSKAGFDPKARSEVRGSMHMFVLYQVQPTTF